MKVINFAIFVYLIAFQDRQLTPPLLLFTLLGGGVRLLLFLTPPQSLNTRRRRGRLFLNVVVKVCPPCSCLPAKIRLA